MQQILTQVANICHVGRLGDMVTWGYILNHGGSFNSSTKEAKWLNWPHIEAIAKWIIFESADILAHIRKHVKTK